MKPITLKEFAELAKNDEALKEKIVNCVKPGHRAPQELIDLAAEYGYDLAEESTYSLVQEDEELSDEQLSQVAGGGLDVYFCYAICKIIGYPDSYCD